MFIRQSSCKVLTRPSRPDFGSGGQPDAKTGMAALKNCRGSPSFPQYFKHPAACPQRLFELGVPWSRAFHVVFINDKNVSLLFTATFGTLALVLQIVLDK